MTFALDGRRVLVVGAHPDDAELGAGATLAAVCRGTGRALIVTMTLGGSRGDVGTRAIEADKAADHLGADWRPLAFADLAVTDGPDTSRAVEAFAGDMLPDLVLTHWPLDTHPDHRATAAAVASACRPGGVADEGLTLAYFEGPTSRRFVPDLYVPVDVAAADAAAAALGEYASQVGPCSVDGYAARLRWRGSQIRVPYADAFKVARAVLEV